jgi:TFIIF-interacting CTD phosphatase-like protein
MLGTVIILIKKIYELLKMNLLLFIIKIQLYYGDDFCRKNDTYFRTANYFLGKNGLSNIYENGIIDIVNKNCVSIVNDISNILNYYKTINNIYFPDFQNIFLRISRLNEQDINNYFYNYLFNSTKENLAAQQRINKFDYSRDNFENSKFYENNNYIDINNIINNTTFQNQNQNYTLRPEEDENEQLLNNIILSYKKNKELPPFLKNKSQKKYTLILDLEDTLINISITNDRKIIIQPRPGLISFLTGVKPFYEIIAFSKLSKNYSESIIRLIEGDKKLFDYNLYRNHCTLVGKNFVKDISRIGRDIKRVIMVDDLAENLKDHIDNGILILPYDGNNFREDRVLLELKKMLILFHRLGYQDLRNALKSYKSEIYQKITLGLDD